MNFFMHRIEDDPNCTKGIKLNLIFNHEDVISLCGDFAINKVNCKKCFESRNIAGDEIYMEDEFGYWYLIKRR